MDFSYIGFIGTRIMFILGLVVLIASVILESTIVALIGFGIWGIELIFSAIIILADFISERIR